MIALFAMTRLRAPGLWLASLLACSGALAGCDCGREDGDPVRYAGGETTGTLYQSSDLHGTWLHFPAGRRYQLLHDLPATPDQIFIYLAFTPDPMPEDATGNISPSTGNAALIEAANDRYIQVRNDTCSGFYVRVVAEVGGGDGTPGAGGAGGAGGN